MAYVWGWPLVNMANRSVAFSTLPGPGLIGGVVPAGFNTLTMMTDYISPDERAVACPNQDVTYGFGVSQLDMEPIVLQIPDFGDRFWVYPLYDQRTDEFSRLGKAYGTEPGFYLVAGPGWTGKTPDGITAVLRSSTDMVLTIPRVFMDDTAEDRAAIQPILSQINVYQLSKFDGTMQLMDWKNVPVYPMPPGSGKTETTWVYPETFFDQLPRVLENVPPQPGEEALYHWISSVLDAAAKDPQIKQALTEAALAADAEIFSPFRQWQYNGRPAGNGNPEHFFHKNSLGRYSLGTKNKTLRSNPDGSLTLYAGAASPGADRESNWLPAPDGTFSLYLRCYWPDQAILDGTWLAPSVALGN